MKRIILVLVLAALVVALAAGPVSALDLDSPSCTAPSAESQCLNYEPELVLNFGACQAAVATNDGGEEAKEFAVENPYRGDGAALVCNAEVLPPPPG